MSSFLFQTANVSAASITLTVPSTALNLAIKPDGAFHQSDASGSISVKTDGPWGYNVSIKAKSNTALVNGANSLPTISTSPLTSDKFTANTWGFMPNKVGGVENTTNFYAVTTSDTILENTTAPNGTANNYTITLGAKVDSTVVSGVYF